ncbi:MAG: glycosyltransferase [Caldithrix sp.]|nr:glycosyltransferase [Caldithrix sp.]
MWFWIFYSLLVFLFLGYAGVLIYLRLGLNRANFVQDDQIYPSVSVVVCAHNEQKNLPACLNLLDNQQYPMDKLEFIIVNDRSSDRTEEILQSFTEQRANFHFLSIRDRLPFFAPKKRAIDTAVKQAQGDIILLTDADGRPGPQWVKSMVQYFTPDTDMVIGYAPYQVKPSGHKIKKILALEYFSHAAVACATTGLNYPVTCVGTNMAYRKPLYLDLDGFGPYKNRISGDDDLFLTRVRECGNHTIKYAVDHKTHVYNNPPALWSKFIHQRVRYASKGFDYPIQVTLALIALYMFNVLMVAGLAALFLNWTVFVYTLPLFLMKGLMEFRFLNKASRMLCDRRYLHYFPVAAILHLPYVVAFGLLGQILNYQWAASAKHTKLEKTIPEEVL